MTERQNAQIAAEVTNINQPNKNIPAQISSVGREIQDSGFKIQDLGFKIQDSRFKIQNLMDVVCIGSYECVGSCELDWIV